MTTGNLYHLLGVSSKASAEDIKAAYRDAARRFHPDVNPGQLATEEFKSISNAYSILSDTDQRLAYDAALTQLDSGGPLLATSVMYSREAIRPLDEQQVVYALVNIQPGISSLALPTPPVNLCIVIDRSTSMHGLRLDRVKEAVLQVINSLNAGDTCSVIAFSDRAEVIVPTQRGDADRAVAKAKVTTIHAGGGTEILEGLLCGLLTLHPQLSASAVNHLLLLTDGQTYGDEGQCLLLAMLAAADGITISGLGLGEEWNDKFLDELTSCTGGVAAYIDAPEQVAEFIQKRVHGLGSAYAERVEMGILLDAGIILQSAFKIGLEAGPVPENENPMRLGSLSRQKSLAVLLKFLLPPQADNANNRLPIARLSFRADVVSLGRHGERSTLDLMLPVNAEAEIAQPPPAMIDALSKISQYKLQERARQEAEAGDTDQASKHLSALATRLFAGGHAQLAKVALAEARQLEQNHLLSEDAKKHLKYGTRALIAPSSTRTPL